MDRQVGSFVWDIGKELANIRKHHVDFVTAARAFADPSRKIFIDERHRSTEERLFCVGRVEGRVVPVRFTYRGELIRIYGAGYWRKGKRYYDQAN